MKKLLILAALAIAGCSKSPEKRAERAVKEYLKKNLNDPSSYESVSYSKLDTAFENVALNKDQSIIDTSNTAALKYKQVGWFIIHQYRAKNGFGALTLHKTQFKLTKECDTVLEASEVN